MTFNHAVAYLRKVKDRYADEPDVYKQFLGILQSHHRDEKPIQEVYAEVTQLFSSHLDHLEEFRQFLPNEAA